MTTLCSPDAAERARTVLAAAPTVDVEARGGAWTVLRHGTDPSGCPLLLVSADPAEDLTCTGHGAVPRPALVTLHAAQLHVLRMPDRIRHRVEIRGTVTEVSPVEADQLLSAAGTRFLDAVDESFLLRLEPARVLLDGEPVGLAEYRAAAPDPLGPVADDLMRDLVRNRQDDLVWLCTLLGPDAVEGATEIAPVGVDRWGLTLRVARPDGAVEHRIGFPDPVERVAALHRMLARLIAFARSATCERAHPPADRSPR